MCFESAKKKSLVELTLYIDFLFVPNKHKLITIHPLPPVVMCKSKWAAFLQPHTLFFINNGRNETSSDFEIECLNIDKH